MVQPEILRFKVYEPLTLVGLDKFKVSTSELKVTGGGHVSQVYAIRQAIAKGLVAYHQKYVDEASKNELKKIFASYDKTLLVADSRRMEPRNSVVVVPEQDSKNLIVKKVLLYFVHHKFVHYPQTHQFIICILKICYYNYFPPLLVCWVSRDIFLGLLLIHKTQKIFNG